MGNAVSIGYPIIAGYKASFGDLVVSVTPQPLGGAAISQATSGQNPTITTAIPFIGLKSLEFKQGKKPGKVYGTAVSPIARTRGKYEASASIELYEEEAAILKRALGNGGQPWGYMELWFDVKVKYLIASTGALNQIVLQSCLISDESHNGKAGGEEALSVKFDLDVMQILTGIGGPSGNGYPATWDDLQLIGSLGVPG